MSFIGAAVLNKQTGTLSMAAGATTTVDSGNLTVRNSAFVALRPMGMDATGTDTTSVGIRLSVVIVDAVTVKVQADRLASNWNQTIAWELSELNPLLYKQVQRGTITSGTTPVAITAVVTTKSELTWLGSTGGAEKYPLLGRLTHSDTTHVAATFNDTLTCGWQSVESR